MISAGGSGVHIRLARRRDLPAIGRFAEAVVHDTYDGLIGVEGADRTLQWWGPLLAEAIEDGLVHVAVTEGQIVGLVERGMVDAGPVVWKLYVAADRRGRGLGARLLQVTMADIGPEHDRVLLEHLASNERAARFYERQGFPVVRRDRSEDAEDDIVWRARRLDHPGDDYASSAEFHEIHMGAVWDDLGDVIADTFGSLPAEGVIVDLGAGSGAGVAAIAERTSCDIIAVEPSASMRAMLLVRLAAAGLTDRVTVVPAAVPAAFGRVPDRVDGVVGAHLLGHLTTDDRRAVLGWVADHLAEDGAAFFTVAGPDLPGPEAVHVDEHRVGRHVYRATHHRPDASIYESHFEVLAGDQILQSRVVTGGWERVTTDEVRSLLPNSVARVTQPRAGAVVVRHRNTD